MSKLIDSFPDYTTQGIFAILGEEYGDEFEWAESHAQDLDLEYFGNHSGDKEVSALVDKYIYINRGNTSPEELTVSQINALVDVLYRKFERKWKKLYNVLSAEYNPLNNYNMHETETPNLTDTETPNITRDREEKNDVNITTTGSQSQNDNIYGFNSATAVPTGNTSGNNTATTTADGDTNKTETTEHETGTRTHTHTGTRTLIRTGNIGVTTSQQMLESEIALWEWNFFDTVFNDVDTILTAQFYKERRY